MSGARIVPGMPKGSIVVGRFGASQRPMRVVRHAVEGSTVVRYVDDNGRAYGRPLEVPTFALATPDEPRFAIMRRYARRNDDGEVTATWYKTEHVARGEGALRVAADVHVPPEQRSNYVYCTQTDDGEGDLIELSTLYDGETYSLKGLVA